MLTATVLEQWNSKEVFTKYEEEAKDVNTGIIETTIVTPSNILISLLTRFTLLV